MNKQTSAEQMYKEYITDIHADSSALEGLLNGERTPANPGARIKHSTGKIAAVTTAAAAIALCAGIGFSSFGSDDTETAPKPAATTPAITTAKQPLTPSPELGDFKIEVTDTMGGTHGMCATLKLTGLTEKGKTLIKQQSDKISSDQNFFGAGIAAMSFSTPVASGDSCTMQVSFVPQKFTGFESNLGVDIFLRFPSDPSGAITDPGRKVSFNIPITPCELHFRSDKGEDIWLTDHYIASGHNPSDPQKKDLYTIKNKDGSVKELTGSDSNGGAGASDYLSYSLCYFRVKLNTADIESITYDGIEFKNVTDSTHQTTQNVSDNSQPSSESAKDNFINATAEKAKLVNNRYNEPDFAQLFKKYNLQQITTAKAVSDSNGSDIICAGVTSDKHFIAVICCKDSLARQIADSKQKKSLEFVLTDSSGNQLCSCLVNWCHKFSDTAVYAEIYSTNTINFKTLPEGVKLSCKNDTSFPNLNVTLTQAEMNTALLNPGDIEPGV